MINVIYTSPLEQFVIKPIAVFLPMGMSLDFSITNTVIFLLVYGYILLTYLYSMLETKKSNLNDNLSLKNGSLLLIPTRWQGVFEIVHKRILSVLGTNVKHKNAPLYFPLVFFIFLFVFSLNAMGLIPYSFTLTSHLIVTLGFGVAIFFGINIITARRHGIKFFSLFLPPGTSPILALLLVPIELLSYIFKPVSLAIRLFANMMAGHTLLKVIAGFAFVLMSKPGILFLLHYVPLLLLVVLFVLESAVAVIQAFVFTILICTYLNDALNLH